MSESYDGRSIRPEQSCRTTDETMPSPLEMLRRWYADADGYAPMPVDVRLVAERAGMTAMLGVLPSGVCGLAVRPRAGARVRLVADRRLDSRAWRLVWAYGLGIALAWRDGAAFGRIIRFSDLRMTERGDDGGAVGFATGLLVPSSVLLTLWAAGWSPYRVADVCAVPVSVVFGRLSSLGL